MKPKPDWKESLERLQKLIQEVASKKEGNLRFNARFVTVSELAGQHYCEKKVELIRLQGEEKTPEMSLGKAAHDELLKGTVKSKRETVWQKIYAGELVILREMPLFGKHKGTIILGLADVVCFYRRLPLLLFEYKFTRNATPFRDHHVQAQLYCYLLQRMGFDARMLRYALVLAPPECKDSGELRTIYSHVIKQPNEDILTVELPEGRVRIYINSYAEGETISDLEWELGYWKQERSAKPTAKATKCRVCPFKDTCESSLAKS